MESMFNPGLNTVNSFAKFANRLIEHTMSTNIFFDSSLLKSIESTLGIQNSLIVVHGSPKNDFSHCAWIDKRKEDHEVHKHPYWSFTRQDRCAKHINAHCHSLNMGIEPASPLLFRSTDIIPRSKYRTSSYTYWLQKNLGLDFYYSLHLPFGSEGRYHLCFYKSKAEKDFSEQELDLIRPVYTLVANAYKCFEYNVMLQTAEKAIPSSHSAPVGHIILDSHLRVLNWNALAANLMSKQGVPLTVNTSLDDIIHLYEKNTHLQVIAKPELGALTITPYHLTSNRFLDFENNFYCLTVSTPPVGGPQSCFDALSAREQEITQKLAMGMTNAEVADDLFISPHTVRNHISNIFTKLNIKNQKQLVSLYMKHHKNSLPKH